MKLKNQCCTLEQGRKLKELGITEDSAFAWVSVCYDPLGEKDPALEMVYRDDYTSIPAKHGEYLAPAFTVAELGQMLGSEVHTSRTGSVDSQYANWEWSDEGNGQGFGLFETEAEARGHMLIYYLEQRYITAEEANNRLINS